MIKKFLNNEPDIVFKNTRERERKLNCNKLILNPSVRRWRLKQNTSENRRKYLKLNKISMDRFIDRYIVPVKWEMLKRRRKILRESGRRKPEIINFFSYSTFENTRTDKKTDGEKGKTIRRKI